jgi:hypothetical protein
MEYEEAAELLIAAVVSAVLGIFTGYLVGKPTGGRD